MTPMFQPVMNIVFVTVITMGSEQSREATIGVEAVEERVASQSNQSATQEETIDRDSPRPSICSDGDLPYISYTVNRPIGGEFMVFLCWVI